MHNVEAIMCLLPRYIVASRRHGTRLPDRLLNVNLPTPCLLLVVLSLLWLSMSDMSMVDDTVPGYCVSSRD